MSIHPTSTVRKIALLSVATLALPVLVACGVDATQDPVSPTAPQVSSPTESPTGTVGSPTSTPTSDIALTDDDLDDVISDTPSLSTLEEALDEAELEDTLEDGGPFTVFAPSDAAFAALPPATLQQLLQDENRETLRQILLYHVVPGQLTADQLVEGELSTTVPGESLSIQTGEQVTVNGATVIEPNIAARNGVVHIIDQVILPPGVAL